MEIVKRVRVTSGPKRHRAFPGLLRLNDGTLLLTYREGSDHWPTDDSVLRATRSTDGGTTWSDPTTILQETGWGFSAHHGPIQLSDGSILLPGMSLRHVEGRRGFRVHSLRSDDGGDTWDVRQIGPMPG